MARAGNALAVQGQIEAAMLRGGRAAGQQTRQLSAMEQQFRALGTTIRYALAGGLVFGITGLVGKLNQLQQQLGLIAAIGPTAGVSFNKSQLGDFLNQIEQRAVDARTPVNELNSSVINFLSTVQNSPRNEIPDIVANIGIASKLAQTPVEDLTKAVTTLNIGAGRQNNLKNINALLREWYHLIATAPGGIAAAPQIAQQLGPLASVAQFGRLTPEQMFGFTLGSLRFGATPSTALRGTQYFLQSLFQPTGAQAKALSAAGFTPTRLKSEGGAKFVIDYLNYVRNLGANASPTTLRKFGNQVDLNPDTEAALAPNQNIQGYSPQALAFLRKTLGRIHGIRTAAVLIAQLQRRGQIQSLTEDLQDMHQLWQNEGKFVNEYKNAVKNYQKQTPLQAAAIGLNTLSTQLQTAIAPLANIVAGGITATSQAAAKHPHETQFALAGGAALVAALGLGRLFRGGRGINPLSLLRRGGGSAFVAAQAVEDIAQGGATRGASPTNPLYVIVVGQLFGGPGGGGLVPGGNWKKPPTGWTIGKGTPEEPKFGAPKGATRAFGVLGAGVIIDQLTGGHVMGTVENTLNKIRWKKHTLNLSEMNRVLEIDRRIKRGDQVSPDEMAFFNKYGGKLKDFGVDTPLSKKRALDTYKENMSMLGKIFDNISKAAGGGAKKTEVSGGVDLNIKIIDPFSGKTKDARVHVPLSTVHQGGRVPISRGKRKSARVDFTVGGVRTGGGAAPQ